MTRMKWLLSAYSQGWNRLRQRRGHVFQGRYKAVPINASDSDTHYIKALAGLRRLKACLAHFYNGNAQDPGRCHFFQVSESLRPAFAQSCR
jgi:putative transposase